MSRSKALEIELEIIKRLPVKSLIRFISACKAWKSLIKCSEFVAGYRVRPTQPHDHLLIKYSDADRDIEVKIVDFVNDHIFPQQKFALTVPPILKLFYDYEIIGSSCGLLCFGGYYLKRENMVVLWNPTIGKSIVVDVPNVLHRPFKYVVGFGVCPDTNDPKLVKITYIDHDYKKMESISCSIPCQVMVFTLSSKEWTPSRSNQLPRKSIEFTDLQTVIGQFIYFRAYDWFDDGQFRNLIMSFDMSTEEFREIDLPDSLADDMWHKYDMSVSRLRESLVVLVHREQVCDVWMMEHGDSKAFTKIFTISAPYASVSRTLGFRKSGEPIVELMGYNDNKDVSTLAAYEPCSKHIMFLGIHGSIGSFYGSSYTESLLLLD